MISAALYRKCLRVFLFLCLPVSIVAQTPTFAPTENGTTTTTESPTASPVMGSTTTSTSAPSTPPVDDSNLSIYQSALQRDLIVADLAALASLQTLLDTRTLTFFAPVNEAFEAVHPTILDYLRDPSNVLILREYLLGHVVSGEIPAATLSTYQNVTFESSQTSPITVDDNDDIFIGFSKILSGNIAATNGLIHLLDGIIGIPTLPQLLSRFGPFLLQILRATELVDQMDGKTLFGPSLFAFSGLSESFPNLTNAVLTDGAFVAHLTEILLAHAVPDILFGTDLEDGQNITMVNGDNYTISITNRTISLSPGTNNGIATVQGNAVTVQTIVYQTDGLLYPSFLEMTLVDVASGYTPMLASFLVIAELDDLLKNEFNMTVFAPSDAAFSALSPVTLDFFQKESGKETLQAILSFHVAPGTYASTFLLSDVVNMSIASLYREGEAMVSVSSDDGSILLNGDASVIERDIVSNNGIVHIIDTVMSLPAETTPTPPSTVPPPSPPEVPPTPMPVSGYSITWSTRFAILLLGCLQFVTTCLVVAF